jgi:hypothetical protein
MNSFLKVIDELDWDRSSLQSCTAFLIMYCQFGSTIYNVVRNLI